jgi:hypothetical protein
MNAQQTTDNMALVNRLMKRGLLSIKPSEPVPDSHWNREKKGDYHFNLDGPVTERLLSQKKEFTLPDISREISEEQKLDLDSIRKIVQRIADKLRNDGKINIVSEAIGSKPMIYKVA